MNRRQFMLRAIITTTALVVAPTAFAASGRKKMMTIIRINKSDEEWRQLLSPEQFQVLRREATERSHSSELNKENRLGTYHCAGCDLPLFSSDKKFNSGTGWPSFYAPIEHHTEIKKDFKLFMSRTEYHCARCGGHQGHIFDDGPEPTGQRWCNNGVALRFIPDPGT